MCERRDGFHRLANLAVQLFNLLLKQQEGSVEKRKRAFATGSAT